MKYDVIGIGNALMDILVNVGHEQLLEMNLKKGVMTVFDAKEIEEIEKKLGGYVKIAPGGSVANTMHGIAQLGGKVIFIGKVGHDEHGAIYEQKMVESGVKSKIVKKKGTTGKVITFITPDTERTFATHLGIAIELEKEELFEEDIKDSTILHLEGYQLENPKLRRTLLHAMDIAKANNVKISIDLSDPSLVERNLSDFLDMVKTYADIVFANEEEAKVFTGEDVRDALDRIGEMCEIAVVKVGAKGSLVKKGDKVFEIEGFKVKTVDTTGAGDSYAAGFLYGLTNGMSLDKCGRIGSWIASKVVSQIGARVDVDKEELKKILG
ncbi:adenosine kinase [Candidatus Woesearchaeota archaeon]|nr:adenosine kinase [Candidatus Woesearchaeota archaeon]